MAAVLEGGCDGIGSVLRSENALGVRVASEFDLCFVRSLEMLRGPGSCFWGLFLHRLLFFVVFAEHSAERSVAVMGYLHSQLKFILLLVNLTHGVLGWLVGQHAQ